MKAKTKLHKLLSLLLALVMVVGLLPATSLTAYAAEVYPDASQVSINEKAFYDTRLYYTNGAGSAGSLADNPNWNAHYDPTTGILELKNFDDGYIRVGGTVKKDITIKLTGTNKITSTSEYGIWNSNGGDITITADSKATLEINVENSETATGISAETGSGHATGSVTLQGYADVIVKAKTTGEYKYAYGIKGRVNASVIENASFKAICSGTNNGYGYGIYADKGVTIDTNGTIDIDVTGCAGSTSIGCIGSIYAHTLTKVGKGILKYPSAGLAIAPTTSKFSESTHAINKDTINRVESYRYGIPYTVTVESGMADVYGLMNKKIAQFVKGDTVTVTANTISDLAFKKWTSADVTVASETSATTTFTMPEKAVTVTANYNLFTTEPSFARTSDTQGTISFTLAATPSSAPKLVEKDSDTVVGSTYFYGSTLDRSGTVSDGSGPYNVPAGEYRIAVEYGGTWLYSDVFTVSYAGTAPAATVNDVTVSGTTGTAIADTNVNITLTNDKFKAIAIDTDVTSWFTNLPNGLEAKVKTAVNADDITATITISGTPTAASTEQIAITIPADQLIVNTTGLAVTANANAKFYISAPTYSVTINAGANMTLASGNANQSGLSGAMTDTVYTAADGYYFPTDYSVAAVNGINVTRNSYTQITVYGTPTANTTITLASTTAKTKEATPSATFAANDTNSGILSNVENGMKYSLDGGSTWSDITGSTADISSGVSAEKDIKVYKPTSDSNTKLDSDIQTIDVTKAATPTGVIGVACTASANNDGKLQDVTTAMQYKKSDASGWTTVSGTEVTGLTDGTYYVRIKASGKALASDNQTVEIAAYGVPVLTGTVNISGNKKFGEALTASVSGDNSDSDNFTYTWKRGSTEIGSGNTYTLTAEDIGQTVTCVVNASDCTGTISNTTGTIEKADGPAAPVVLTGVAPTTSGGADGKIQHTDATMEWSNTTGFATKTDCAETETTVGVAGTYYVRVKETTTHNAGAYATVEVPAYVAPVYSIGLDVTGTYTFTAATAGYGAQTAKTVTVNNTGTVATGDLTVNLSGTNASDFTLSKSSISSLAVSGSDTFTVVPKTDLAAGTYIATVTVDGSSVTAQSFNVSFKVNAVSSGGGYIPPVQKPTIEAGEGVKVTLSSDGTVATITVEAGYDLADVVLNGTSKGKVTEVKGLKTGDKLAVTATKKAAEPTKEDIIAIIESQQLVARSKVTTSPNGKKAILITWYDKNGNEVTFDGVQIFRSTKRNSGYGTKPIFTSVTGKYYNTAVKAGTKYYYKVRGFVVIDGQKYYTDYSLKAIRTAK